MDILWIFWYILIYFSFGHTKTYNSDKVYSFFASSTNLQVGSWQKETSPLPIDGKSCKPKQCQELWKQGPFGQPKGTSNHKHCRFCLDVKCLFWNPFWISLLQLNDLTHTLTACLQHGNISWQGYLCSCRHLPLETLKNSDSLWLVLWAPMIKAATGLGGKAILEAAGWNEVCRMDDLNLTWSNWKTTPNLHYAKPRFSRCRMRTWNEIIKCFLQASKWWKCKVCKKQLSNLQVTSGNKFWF